MDCRLDPYRLLDIAVGDAHIVRNGGGLLTEDALRSIVLSQHLLETDEVVVIQHTNCGMLHFDDESFRAEVTARIGVVPPWDVPGFDDVRASLRTTVEALEQSPLLRSHRIRGLLYDTDRDVLEAIS